MDGARFDHLTRTLARGASRRGLLKGLAAGLLGGLSGLRAADAAAQRPARQANGDPCTRATECASFHCVDGVCCDTTCAGQCESCATGVCHPVTGAPEPGRAPCPGDGPCAATCDGVTTSHCAAYPDAATTCGPATCATGWLTTYACAGNGACAPTTTSCAPFGCDAAGLACATGCEADADCGAGSHCDAPHCLPDEGIGEDCDEDTDCQSGICVTNVCCAERCDECQVCNLPGNAGFCAPDPHPTTCGDGGRCCDGDCIDPQTDVEHCGGCNNMCQDVPNGTAICVNGDCGVACADGFIECGGACYPIVPLPDTPAGAHMAWIMEQVNGAAAMLTVAEAALHLAEFVDPNGVVFLLKEDAEHGPYAVVFVEDVRLDGGFILVTISYTEQRWLGWGFHLTPGPDALIYNSSHFFSVQGLCPTCLLDGSCDF